MVSAIVIIIAVIIGLLLFLRIVSQSYVYVVERLGKFSRLMNPGLHVIIPVIDRIARKVDMREQGFDFPPQPVITKDNVAISIDSVVFMRVTDPKMFTYGAQNPIQGIANLSATTLRSIIGSMEFDETLTSREMINTKMLEVLDAATDPWGIKITRVEVKNIQPPQDVLDVMQKQMTAEREKRQATLEAEAYKIASITHAEGDKQARLLSAQAESEAAVAIARGRAESIRITYEAEAAGIRMLSEAGISDAALRVKALQALTDVANGNATKIFFPADMSSLGMFGLASDMITKDGFNVVKNVDVKDGEIRHDYAIGSSDIVSKAVTTGHSS